MIPTIISLENASLIDSKYSRSFSVIIDYDNNFNVLNVQFKKTTIKVKKNLSYEIAQNMINSNSCDQLVNLYEFGKKLFVKTNKLYDTHEMVEVYMILANKLVAEHLSDFCKDNVILRTQKTNVVQDIKQDDNLLYDKYLNTLNERAIYTVGITDNTYHTSLGLKYYTHFTSPIRRYIDIMVHRALYKSINGDIQQTPQNITIETINTYQKIYKKIQLHTKLLQKLEEIDIISEFDVNIISLNSGKNIIRVYIPKIDLELEIKVFNDKFKQILENISDDENELTIINTQTENKLTLKLFQQIKIQIVQTCNFLKPITCVVINPNVQDILNLK